MAKGRNMKNIIDVKDYWDRQPCNVKRSKSEPGTLLWCEDTRNNKYRVEPHIPEQAEFKKWAGKKVLEVGCGIGITACSFAQYGAYVTAIDISEKSLELAKKRAKLLGVEDRIKFYQGNAEELYKIIPLEEYDLIWSFGVIHHSPNPRKIINCLRQLMGPHTELRIMVYNKMSWKVFWILLKYGKMAFWKIDKLIADNSEAQTGCPITYTYTKRSIKKLLRNLTIHNISVEHIFPYRIKDYIHHRYVKVWYFRWMPEKWFKWLEKRIGWHMCVTARL